MMMSFERFIAFRYIVSRRQIGFVTMISVISIVGVMIGVAALIIVLSVFNGFNDLVTNLLVTFDPHIEIESVKRVDQTAYEPVLRFLGQQSDVVGFGAYASGKAMVVSRNINRVVNIRGIDPTKAALVSGLPAKIVLGKLDFDGENRNGIVLGLNLADRLGTVVGDTLAIVSPAGSELALLQFGQPVIRRYHVAGIYESNNRDYDSYYAFVGLDAAQSLFALGNRIDGIEARFRDSDEAPAFKGKLVKEFGDGFRVNTWYDLHRELYTVMLIERWAAYIILCLIIAVASFNLLGSLTMSVIEKTRDIGILKSMGATATSISRIFRLQGIAVGVIGTILGLILGLTVVYMQKRYHLFPLDPTVYIIPAIPVQVRIPDLFFIAAAAIGLCSFAAMPPSRRAADLIPSEAIRWE